MFVLNYELLFISIEIIHVSQYSFTVKSGNKHQPLVHFICIVRWEQRVIMASPMK